MIPESEFGKLEQALLRAGSLITYPPTPALAVRVHRALVAESAPRGMERLPRWSRAGRVAFAIGAALVVALALLLAFPDARDALAQLLGLRTVRIFFVTPTPTSTVMPVGTVAPPTATPKLFTQCCETTLDDARARVKFAISLPPGQAPSRVYLQTLPDFGNAQQLIFVFGNSSVPRFTLYEAQNFVYGKGLTLYGKGVTEGTVLAETTVNGQRALWLSGAPHLLVYLDAKGTPVPGTERPVDANTLDWESGDVTLRLETKAGEQDAVRFAESLSGAAITPTPTPVPTDTLTPTPILTPVTPCCPTTLSDAQQHVGFKISLPPETPTSLVYLQNDILGPRSGVEQVVLVFGDPKAPSFTVYEAQLVVYEQIVGFVGKGLWPGTVIDETKVNGQYALWFSGTPHVVMFLDRSGQPVVGSERSVYANTLVWENGQDTNSITYRLETNLGEDEAVRFSESLR